MPKPLSLSGLSPAQIGYLAAVYPDSTEPERQFAQNKVLAWLN
jgi:hypothetical protein